LESSITVWAQMPTASFVRSLGGAVAPIDPIRKSIVHRSSRSRFDFRCLKYLYFNINSYNNLIARIVATSQRGIGHMDKKRILLAGIFAVLVALGGVAAICAQAGDSPKSKPPNKTGQSIAEVRLGF
jgi:hypothetical protein